MKKRALSLLLALVMVLTMLPVTALAVDDSEPNDSIPKAQAAFPSPRVWTGTSSPSKKPASSP